MICIQMLEWTVVDIFPTDIRFIADTPATIQAAPYSGSLKNYDVIKMSWRK